MADKELYNIRLGQDNAFRTLRPDGWVWSLKNQYIVVLEHSRTDAGSSS